MRSVIPVLVLITLVTGCKEKTDQSTDRNDKEQTTNTSSGDPSKDSAEIRNVITGFYNWYNKNYAKFSEYDLYDGIKKKDEPPYKINWDGVEKYQQYIRTSVPQLGEEFLANQKKFFEEVDSAFKIYVEDDIPYGFDHDWYIQGQDDPQYLVDEINKDQPWKISWENEYAIVNIPSGYETGAKPSEDSAITITMKKENGVWKIAKIWRETLGQ